MADDSVSATRVIDAPAEAIFAVLVDPASHAAIDGTGWVRESADSAPLAARGQIFQVAMYHPNHPDGDYNMSNEVVDFDPPNTVSWKPGYDAGGGTLGFGGWIWRYDLAPVTVSTTTVTLSYDWSAVSDTVRKRIGFPPFPADHLSNSLAHLAELLAS
jgi:uncharacterized protein YndB with AHSA1/START domain